jgi:hypothetical protein
MIRVLSPLHPIADFEILTSIDAADAIELSRPQDFESGVIVLFLDDDRLLGALAVARAPANSLTDIAELLIDARLGSPADSPTPRFSGLVFGVIGPDALRPSANQIADWQEAQHLLAGHGVALAHLITVSEDNWLAYRFE